MKAGNWLVFSTVNPSGIGGAETHIAATGRELRKRGFRFEISSSPAALHEEWDVVQIHGSTFSPIALLKFHQARKGFRRQPTILMTLHGSSWERMQACGEWFWAGGYAAAGREILGIQLADAVSLVRPGIGLEKMAARLGKKTVISGNGWDSWEESEKDLMTGSVSDSAPWCFIGRGSDPVKGTALLRECLENDPAISLRVAPGEGFPPGHSQISATGSLDAAGIRRLLGESRGLVLTSFYEGYPLVVLEALALGVPVILPSLRFVSELGGCEGVTVFRDRTVECLRRAFSDASLFDNSHDAREKRKMRNRAQLPRWSDTVDRLLPILG